MSLFLVCVLVALAVMVPVSAGAVPVEPEQVEYEYLSQYLTQQADGTLQLNISKEKAGLSEAEYHLLQQNLAATNQMIQEGLVTADGQGNITFTAKTAQQNPGLIVRENELVAKSLGRNAGANKVVQYWWGFKVYLNNAISVQIARGTSWSGAILSAFGSSVGIKIIGVITIIGGYEISTNNRGRGVIITSNQLLHTIVGPASIIYSLLSIVPQ